MWFLRSQFPPKRAQNPNLAWPWGRFIPWCQCAWALNSDCACVHRPLMTSHQLHRDPVLVFLPRMPTSTSTGSCRWRAAWPRRVTTPQLRSNRSQVSWTRTGRASLQLWTSAPPSWLCPQSFTRRPSGWVPRHILDQVEPNHVPGAMCEPVCLLNPAWWTRRNEVNSQTIIKQLLFLKPGLFRLALINTTSTCCFSATLTHCQSHYGPTRWPAFWLVVHGQDYMVLEWFWR